MTRRGRSDGCPEEYEQAIAAGIHHAGQAQGRQQAGRTLDRFMGRGHNRHPASGEVVDLAGSQRRAPRAISRMTVRMVPSTGLITPL